MTHRSLLLAQGLLCVSSCLMAQMEGPAFLHSGKGVATTFATDYQSIGINPANLGWSGKYEDKKATFGFMEGAGSMYSDAVTRKELSDHYLGNENIRYTLAQKRAAASAFTGADCVAHLDVRSVGFSITTPKAGGFAYHTADRMQWYSTFQRQASEILFLGFNAPYFDAAVMTNGDTVATAGLSDEERAGIRIGLASDARGIAQLMNGSSMRHLWVREHAIAWGYKVGTTRQWSFFAGVTARYLQGLGMIDIGSNGSSITAFSALSPGYDIDYGTAAGANPSTVRGKGYRSVGNGFSGDIGFSAELAGKARFGIAYTNVGSITWNGNVYSAADDQLHALGNDGFHNIDLADQLQLIYNEPGILQWQGQQDRLVATPAQLRTGGSFRIKERTEVGFDVVVPTNDAPGNLERPMFGVGGEMALSTSFSVNAGITAGGVYKTMVPFGINFRLPSGSWEAGIATRDMPSLFMQDPGMLSYCFGFLRFRV